MITIIMRGEGVCKEERNNVVDKQMAKGSS
jgi:hypothetical protein